MDWVTVGDPGNASDPQSGSCASQEGLGACGSVADSYRISQYEVTHAQYAESLNHKAASEPLEPPPQMTSTPSNPGSGIIRSGSPGIYTYAVDPSSADRPVVFVSFDDSLRFANWLNNGQSVEPGRSQARCPVHGESHDGLGPWVERPDHQKGVRPS
jgi:formylglycine-generating enzyme required for sulfatase activity